MNILFLTLNTFESLKTHTIYSDLLNEFVKNGHNIYAISPVARKQNIETYIVREERAVILRLKIGNMHNVNLIEKGLSTLAVGNLYKAGVKKYFSDTKFDLVLYSTPPITLVSVIKYIKDRDNAKTYLLLKDIFPQNAVDIGMLSKHGIKGIVYKYFRMQEKKLYAVSDYIGCMSKANVEYIISHNPEIDKKKVEVCPNCVEVIDRSVDFETRKKIRNKYELPLDKPIFVYGGNLGKPQGIPFLVECLKRCGDLDNAYFLIVGSGTEYSLINKYIETQKPHNIRLMQRLPKEDYDKMVGACDVGLIFLDYRFTIPNFPSRILAYMQAKLPVLACTDTNTDIGDVIIDGNFGWWCGSNNADGFRQVVEAAAKSNTELLGNNAYEYLQKHYTAEHGFNIIQKRLK